MQPILVSYKALFRRNLQKKHWSSGGHTGPVRVLTSYFKNIPSNIQQYQPAVYVKHVYCIYLE